MRERIVFVAGEVGGLGGMEHQSEQLIRRLLDDGVGVTVIARSCELPPHELLEFLRVRTPTRPFAVAYPTFIAVATVLVGRRRQGGLLHTTGAMALNRADVTTVHYCHRAARGRLTGTRAARAGAAYRFNAELAAVMSRAAEAWCYRPARLKLLCAVSEGVAGELEREFPGMRDAIRAIPNGVDTDRFRPDHTARCEVRAELGVADADHLALFVGGDWERKGLRAAVAALALAPDWQLAVAGNGQREPLLALAGNADTVSRLRFLGPVRDMPRIYAAADAFVLPTGYEAFPLVALEAAASGLPLLVTRVNGVDEMLEDGHNGWFITPDGEDIARRLNQLSADRELGVDMGAQARATATTYTWDAMAERYEAVYAELGLTLRHHSPV
jgi:glycosyltransferase involved in cell wall biosynthesis